MGTTAVRPAPAELKRPLPATRLGRGVLSDEQLARMVYDGDPVVFSTIYERYRAPLSRYCRSILHHPDDAADAFQNTMMAALVGLERELPSGPLRPWLYRIAHNESIDLMRRRKPNVDLVAEIPQNCERSADPEVDDQLQALLTDLRVLPERQRGALLMRELAGLEYDQIGRSFDTSAVAARKLVYEARVTLGFMRDGRDASCELICGQISDGDGRTLRNRTVRAHIDSCADCAAFERSLHSRRERLALVPALPLASGGIWLATSIGGGAGATKALAGSTVVAGGAMAGTSAVGAGAGATAASGVVSTFGGALAVKCLAVCSALAVAGAGAAIATHGATHPSRRAAHDVHVVAVISHAAAPVERIENVAATTGTAHSGASSHLAATGAPAPQAGAGRDAGHGLHATFPKAGATAAGSGSDQVGSGQRMGAGSSATGSTTNGVSSQGGTAPSKPTSTSTSTSTTPASATSGQSTSGTSEPSSSGTGGSSAAASSAGGAPSASQTSSTTFAEGIERLVDAGMQEATAASQTESSIASAIASALGAAGIEPAGPAGTSGSSATSTSTQTTSTTSNTSPVSGFFSLFSKSSN